WDPALESVQFATRLRDEGAARMLEDEPFEQLTRLRGVRIPCAHRVGEREKCRGCLRRLRVIGDDGTPDPFRFGIELAPVRQPCRELENGGALVRAQAAGLRPEDGDG